MLLVNKVKDFLQTHSLVQNGDKISLAVSGGLDSVALLHLFVQIQNEFKMQLNIVHVNHGLRPEADSDEIFVKDLAEEYNLGFYSTKVDAIVYAKQNKLSLEESARELRYKFFEEILHKTQFDKLATAHTANDQAETIIDHFLRGSGISGLRGMGEKRSSYIRPFLGISRPELEEYVEQNRLSYREDKTNRDIDFKRNRIRHELIPFLQENFNPNLIGTLNRTSEIFRETEQFLQEYAADACKTLISVQNKNEIILEIDGFLNYNNLIKKYILFNCCSLLLINRNQLNYHKLTEILELIDKRQIGKKTAINRDFDVIIDHDGLVITGKTRNTKEEINIDLTESSSVRFKEFEFKWTFAAKPEDVVFNKCRTREYLDFEKTGSQVKLHSSYPGAYFIPLNFTGKKKIADYFSDCKVPLRLRRNVPILECETGIVWICGYQIDDRFKVTKKTKTVLKMEMRKV